MLRIQSSGLYFPDHLTTVQLYIQQKVSPLMAGRESQKNNFFIIIIRVPHYVIFYGPSECHQEQEHKEEGQELVRAATVLMNVILPWDTAHVLQVPKPALSALREK